jgi:hypothetical protein
MSYVKKYHFCTSEGILNQEKLAINACILSGEEFPHSLVRSWWDNSVRRDRINRPEEVAVAQT